MNDISLKLDERVDEGKRVAKLRENGIVPSVVYGGHIKPFSTQSPLIDTLKIIKTVGKHTPVHLIINGKNRLAIVKSIDFDPVRRTLRHVAFHTIKQNEIITTEVPIILVGQGESPAERAGLIVLQVIEKIEVKAKPADLPESLKLSVINLADEDSKLIISDITLPNGVIFADVDQDMDLVIANVYEPSALQAANEAIGGEAEAEIEIKAETGGAVENNTTVEFSHSKPETK